MLTVYTFENPRGEAICGSEPTLDVDEAEAYARKRGCRMVANYYVLSARDVQADFSDERILRKLRRDCRAER